MKFLVFSPYYPPHIGGLENHAHEFNIRMANNGHNITVFTPQIPKHAAQQDDTNYQILIIRFPAFEIIQGYPLPKIWSLVFWKQLRTITTASYDIVISRTRFFITSIMALWYSKKHHIRYVHIEHGSDFVQLDSKLSSIVAKLYDYTLGRLIFYKANSVIANSKASGAFVHRMTNGNVTPVVIYRGIESHAVLPKEISNTTAHPIIIYIGRLIDGKGVQDLIQALANIQDKQWVAWIVGDGPYAKKLQDTVHALSLDARIIFLGEQSHSEALRFISSADIVINPSYTEGIPSTIIEAARAGKAIIATNVGGTPEVIQHQETGFLYTPKDIDTLAEYMKIFIDSPAMRNEFGMKAQRAMEGKFSWERAMVQYKHVWNNRQN